MIKQSNNNWNMAARQAWPAPGLSFVFWSLKFIYSEKATIFFEISSLLLTAVHTVKSKVEILQNFVAFSEYMNFIN